jgi:hypothetical protein
MLICSPANLEEPAMLAMQNYMILGREELFAIVALEWQKVNYKDLS